MFLLAFAHKVELCAPQYHCATNATYLTSQIGIDIVGIGENEANAAALEALVTAANKDGNSRLLLVPAGELPSAVLAASAIMMGDMAEPRAGGDGGAGNRVGGGAGGSFIGGVDPTLDPELAEVMRLSLEEERARQAREDAAAVAASAAAAPAASSAADSTGAAESMPVDEETALLAQALALSTESSTPVAAPAAAAALPAAAGSAPASASAEVSAAGSAAAPAAAAAFENPGYVAELMAGLPGVDLSDPDLLAALAAAGVAPPPAPAPPKDGAGGDASK